MQSLLRWAQSHLDDRAEIDKLISTPSFSLTHFSPSFLLSLCAQALPLHLDWPSACLPPHLDCTAFSSEGLPLAGLASVGSCTPFTGLLRLLFWLCSLFSSESLDGQDGHRNCLQPVKGGSLMAGEARHGKQRKSNPMPLRERHTD